MDTALLGTSGQAPRPSDPRALVDRASGPVVGVALGGGGAAALAHVGVLQELVRAGIPIGRVAGTSAGALVGAAFAGGTLERLQETLEGLTWSRVIGLFDPRWPRAGLFEGRKALDLMRPCLRERIEELPQPFAAVATDIHTGEEVMLDRGPTLEAVRASAALPGIFTPQVLSGRTLIDGGLVNPVPVSTVRRLGADFVIAVSLHPLPEDAPSGSAMGTKRSLPQHPHDMGILDILARSSALVQARIAAARFRDDPPEALIVLPTADVGLFELHRASEVIEAGRQVAREAAGAILQLLDRSAARRGGGARKETSLLH